MGQKIGFIAPYAELADIAAEVRSELNLEFPIAVGLFEGALSPAETLVKQGAEVIVSRGGTAALLRNKLEVPIVEIKVTGYDVIRALYPYIGKEVPIAVIGYWNVVYGCRIISKLFGMEIHEIIIPSESIHIDWEAVRQQAKNLIEEHNIQVIVGGTLVKSRLKLDNIEIQLIESGKEAIIQTLEEARHIATVRENERKAYERLRTIIHSVNDGVVATDEHGSIVAANLTAEGIFGFKEADVIGIHISKIIPNTRVDKVLKTGQPELEQLQLTPKGYVVTNRVPIGLEGQVQGVVTTFQEVDKIQSAEQKIRKTLFSRGLFARYSFDDILTEDYYMKRIVTLAKKYAQTDATMLLLGESGTGKELFAQSIHRQSPRRTEAFVAVNCSALPGQLLESELFGYVEGAFTGAKKGGKRGLFELAHNGTIFLDEIGDMDKEMQLRLLRVLEEKQVMRLGSDSIIPVNARVIAATNTDLWQEAMNGNFRLDLYYRLNVLSIKLPPLRERKHDIALLADWFLKKYCVQYGKDIKALPKTILEIFERHEWRGNIRELKNVIERIVLSSDDGMVDLGSVDLMLDKYMILTGGRPAPFDTGLCTGTLDDIKKKAVLTVLTQEGNNIAKAARRLKIDRNTLKKIINDEKNRIL